MQSHSHTHQGIVAFFMVAVGLALGGVLAIGLVLPVEASPGAQDALPTPTLFPVDEVPYALETVGGAQETLTFEYAPDGPFDLGVASVTSQYPRGMVFTLVPESSNGAIEDVILFLRYAHGSGTRVVAEFDSAREVWVAHPWESGAGQPAWTHFEFYWRVRDETGASVDSVAYEANYSDPTREWFRLETPYYVVYWFGMAEDAPDQFAREAARAIAGTHPRRVAGFGRELSYTPVGVIYGSREAMSEMVGSGVTNPTAGGYTSDSLGITVQFVPPDRDDAYLTEWLAHVLTHELTHLYQFDVVGGARGPNWWTEGQADWFAYAAGDYDARLFNLATLQDLPTLSKPVPRNIEQADGGLYLVYDMGASFVNWLNLTYGGMETHRQVVELMQRGAALYDALEQATGKPFFDLENEWRAYIDLPPFTLADLDPASALEPVIDPLVAVGETITLPSTPPLPVVLEAPSRAAASSGQCFANTTVTVVDMGSRDGEDFYKVDCMGQIGWMPRDQLVGP